MLWRGNRAVPGRLGALLCLLLAPLPALAQSTEERLDRIERQLEGRGLINLLNQVEQLQRNIQQLRGDIEVQTHALEDMQRRQRELYLDIDRRLQQLESGGAPPPALTGPGTTTPPLTGPAGMATAPPAKPSGPATISPTPPVAGQAPPPPAVAPPPAAAPAPTPAEEQAEYDKALAVLREGRYADAAAAFNRFMATYPDSNYADNAAYWLGETYYVTRDFPRAMETFSKLVEFHPQSSKVPDARLKIGYIHYENRDWNAARQELSGLVTDYPGTTAARLAGDRLQRMKQEGH
jgi:tol-pal system protein YbgF